MPTLKFYSRGASLVADFEALDANIRRFVGRRHDRTVGFQEKDANGNLAGMSGGFPSTGKPQEVPARSEYMLACQDGHLWAADEATALYCGVQFDPTFGEEHDHDAG